MIDKMPYYEFTYHIKDLIEIFEEKKKAEEDARNKEKGAGGKMTIPKIPSSYSQPKIPKLPKMK